MYDPAIKTFITVADCGSFTLASSKLYISPTAVMKQINTLESRLSPGVYAAGEVLDIDGDCGGFNLQWAWASGYVAGQLGKAEENAL